MLKVDNLTTTFQSQLLIAFFMSLQFGQEHLYHNLFANATTRQLRDTLRSLRETRGILFAQSTQRLAKDAKSDLHSELSRQFFPPLLLTFYRSRRIVLQTFYRRCSCREAQTIFFKARSIC